MEGGSERAWWIQCLLPTPRICRVTLPDAPLPLAPLAPTAREASFMPGLFFELPAGRNTYHHRLRIAQSTHLEPTACQMMGGELCTGHRLAELDGTGTGTGSCPQGRSGPPPLSCPRRSWAVFLFPGASPHPRSGVPGRAVRPSLLGERDKMNGPRGSSSCHGSQCMYPTLRRREAPQIPFCATHECPRAPAVRTGGLVPNHGYPMRLAKRPLPLSL